VTWRRLARNAIFGALVGALAGCTPVPSSTVPPRSAAPSLSLPPPPEVPSAQPLPPLPPRVSASPSPSGFPEGYAVACGGKPGSDRIIAVLRAKRIMDSTAGVTVQLGPLCAGTWQYTVFGGPGREPLQVLTQGPPDALTLVTAGTDVCSAQVRAEAPPGIISVAHCV
jgi:hypothetical protein